jgi:hypothetical protein
LIVAIMLSPREPGRFRGHQVLVSLLIMIAVTACGRRDSATTPLPAAEIPAALEQAFQGAAADLKQAAQRIREALKAPDLPRAFGELQALSSRPDLTARQRETVSRSFLTLSAKLSEAAAQGDAAAGQIVEIHRANK